MGISGSRALAASLVIVASPIAAQTQEPPPLEMTGPTEGRPMAPSFVRPGAPGSEQPTEPGPGLPGGSGPRFVTPGGTPGAGQPGGGGGQPGGQPDNGPRFVTPGGTPGQPGGGQPGGVQPGQPGGVQPGQPGGGQPGQPGGVQPGQPGGGQPGQPGGGQPGGNQFSAVGSWYCEAGYQSTGPGVPPNPVGAYFEMAVYPNMSAQGRGVEAASAGQFPFQFQAQWALQGQTFMMQGNAYGGLAGGPYQFVFQSQAQGPGVMALQMQLGQGIYASQCRQTG